MGASNRMSLYNLFKFIGIRHLTLKPSRAFLTTLGVAFGIALYVAIAIINQSTRESMRESVESVSGKAKLSVSAGIAGFAEDKLESIRTTPGVKTAVPLVEARAFFVGATESADGLQIMGVDLLQETSVRSYKATDQRIIDDPLTFLNQPDSIIITTKMAAERGLKLDSKMTLSTAVGAKEFTVRGLLEPEGTAKAYGGALAIMDIDGARVTFGKENKLDRVDIIPEKDFTVDQVKANLEKTLGPGFNVERPESQSEQTEKVLASYQLILTFFSTLALLVGLFLVMNSISVAIAERKREIGVLRALGATRTSMVTLFVTEVFGIGFVGSILGCFLGKMLSHALVKQVMASVSAQFQSNIQVSHLDFPLSQIILTVVGGTLASIIAALFPALKAASIHPLESMKKNAETFSHEDERRGKIQIIFGFALLVFASLAMVLSWSKIWIGFDLLGKASSVLGSALFGPFLVFLLLKGFRKLTLRLPYPILRISQENLQRSRRRTTANVMSLMVGLYLVMLISTVRASFHDTLTNWLDRIFVADLMVGSNGRFIMADVQPLKESIEKEILQVPGIRPIGENRGSASRVIRFKYEGTLMTIKAHDQYADHYEYKNYAVVGSDRIKTAQTLYENEEPRVLTTNSFLSHYHKAVGDFVEFDTPTGKIPFKIMGVISDYASPIGVFYMNRAVYKKYWKDNLVTGFVLDLAPGYTFEQVRKNIAETVGKKWNLVTISNAEFKNQMQSAIDRTFAYTKAIEYIALLVGLLGLLNTLLISVMERTREIGMLRAVGSTRSQISRMIFSEAILQGFFGAVIAIALGAYIGRLFVTYALTDHLGWIIEFHFPIVSIFSTLLTGVIVAGIAGFFPARKAANLQITEALDYE